MSFLISGLHLVPKNAVSRMAGRFSRSNVSKAIIPWFVRRYRLNLDEAVVPEGGFETLHDLFTRALKPGARVIDPVANLVSPADSVLAQGGAVESDRIVQAKGRTYSLAEMLGEDPGPGAWQFGTFYLAPTDYHRVHSPADLEVLERRSVPGALWPVNPVSVAEVDQLFCVNERVVLKCRHAQGGIVYVVFVGATIVGGIRLAFDEDYGSNQGGQNNEHRVYDPPIPMAKGQELGHFELGSTVVLAWESTLGELKAPLADAIQVGDALDA
ncbi:MAG TPA: phosphatidylserine decarboxylase [Myxococcales bacterium]|jgi:phosphatidylserine decarboxylase|nr:phosphatidylserine decarboxylase [Myxococcales bacterium]|tara:strand:- start:193 stop:1002 length:810 start_codon:yes stop_codon:yes gene_type:complete